jgi:hypothetical protein
MIKPTVIVLIITTAYFLLISVPLQKMQSTDEFQYWTSHGFYNETVRSLHNDWIYDSTILSLINHRVISAFIILILLINTFVFFSKLKKEKFSTDQLLDVRFSSMIILLLSVAINIIQTKFLGTPNLNGRTALFFFPLLSAVTVVALAGIPQFNSSFIKKTFGILLGIVLLSNLTHRVSLKSVKEWYYDQNTVEVINFIKSNYTGKPITLKTSWFFHSSFTYYCETGKAPWIILQSHDSNIDIYTTSDYYYIFAKDYPTLSPNFEVAYKFSEDRWLLKRR